MARGRVIAFRVQDEFFGWLEEKRAEFERKHGIRASPSAIAKGLLENLKQKEKK